MPRLFNRICNTTILHAGPNATDYFKSLGGNQITITDLRVQFDVEKSLSKTPNKASVKITNLNRATRAEVEKKPLIVRIDAGHDGIARHLFTGNLRYGWSKVDGPDWETTLELGDGDRAYRHARVNRSYTAGTSVLTAVKEAAKSMGLEVPSGSFNAELLADLQRQFATGGVIHGPSADEMTRLLAPYGYHWSIQDGKLQVLRDDQIRPDEAILVSQDTGMIGSPEYGAPPAKGKPPTLTIRMLLYPGLTPGGTIQVQSRDITGVFKIQKVKHSGDTHGEDWYSEIQCKPR